MKYHIVNTKHDSQMVYSSCTQSIESDLYFSNNIDKISFSYYCDLQNQNQHSCRISTGYTVNIDNTYNIHFIKEHFTFNDNSSKVKINEYIIENIHVSHPYQAQTQTDYQIIFSSFKGTIETLIIKNCEPRCIEEIKKRISMNAVVKNVIVID